MQGTSWNLMPNILGKLFHISFPGHALHEKDLQRQKGDSPLVSSQEQRELLVPVIKPLINRSSTARCVPPTFYIGFRFFVLLERHKETCLRCHGGCGGRLSPGQTILSASRPARPRPAVPMCAPTRPARGMSGFWIRQIAKIYEINLFCNL